MEGKRSNFGVMSVVAICVILFGLVLLLIPNSWLTGGTKKPTSTTPAVVTTEQSNSDLGSLNSQIAAVNSASGKTTEVTESVKERTTGLLLATDDVNCVSDSTTWLNNNPTCKVNYDYVASLTDLDSNFNGVVGGEDYKDTYDARYTSSLDDLKEVEPNSVVIIRDVTPIGFLDQSTVVTVYNYGKETNLVILRFVSENMSDSGKLVPMDTPITLGVPFSTAISSSGITLKEYEGFYAVYAEVVSTVK